MRIVLIGADTEGHLALRDIQSKLEAASHRVALIGHRAAVAALLATACVGTETVWAQAETDPATETSGQSDDEQQEGGDAALPEAPPDPDPAMPTIVFDADPPASDPVPAPGPSVESQVDGDSAFGSLREEHQSRCGVAAKFEVDEEGHARNVAVRTSPWDVGLQTRVLSALQDIVFESSLRGQDYTVQLWERADPEAPPEVHSDIVPAEESEAKAEPGDAVEPAEESQAKAEPGDAVEPAEESEAKAEPGDAVGPEEVVEP